MKRFQLLTAHGLPLHPPLTKAQTGCVRELVGLWKPVIQHAISGAGP